MLNDLACAACMFYALYMFCSAQTVFDLGAVIIVCTAALIFKLNNCERHDKEEQS